MFISKYIKQIFVFFSSFLAFILFLFCQWLINPSFISFDIPSELRFVLIIGFFVYLIFAIIVYKVIEFMYKEMGATILVFPLFIGIFTFETNYELGIWGGDYAITFWWFQLPFLLTSPLYSTGFILIDRFSD